MLNDENSMTASGSAQSESTTELPNTGTVPEKSATRRHRAATRAAGAPGVECWRVERLGASHDCRWFRRCRGDVGRRDR